MRHVVQCKVALEFSAAWQGKCVVRPQKGGLFIMSDTKTFYSATGKVPYQLTNDYLFQAVLQSSNETLKGLVCSLLHIHPEKVHNVVITNPIELGKKIRSEKIYPGCPGAVRQSALPEHRAPGGEPRELA